MPALDESCVLTALRPVRPVYSLILGTKTMIVLSSDQAVKDLLDKKSSIYSDRPDMFIGQKIASGNLRLVVMVRQPDHLISTVLDVDCWYRDTAITGA
jgi:hypothetical protein